MFNQNLGINISLINVMHIIAIALSRFVSHANGQKYILKSERIFSNFFFLL